MPNLDYFSGASTEAVIYAPAAVESTGVGVGIDTSNFNGKLMLVSAIYNTAGTTPSLVTTFQTSDKINVIDGVDFTGCPGKFTEIAGGPDTVEETITVTFSNATTFAVAGAVTGAIGTGTVGTKFVSSKISFLVIAGSSAFQKDAAYTIDVLEQTYSDIDGATLDDPAASNVLVRTVVDTDKLGSWLRPSFTVAGTDPSYLVGITAYGMVQG